jgi:PAS domain S-box-containing protein
MASQAPGAAEPRLQPLYEALRATPIGVVLADFDGRLAFANRAICSMLGFSEEEMHGKNWMELSLPEEAGGDQTLFKQLVVGSTYHYHLNKRCFRRDGSLFSGHWSVWSLGDRESPFVLAMITDHGQADLARQETEEHFRYLADSLPVMIWTSGVDGGCSYNNKHWLEFSGRSQEEQLCDGWVEGVHPEDRQQCLDGYKRAFARRAPFQREYRLRRHDGEYRWIFARSVPRFNADGTFAGYIGSGIDITERKLAEEAVSGMNRKLIEAQEQERTYVARELHDDISQRLALLSVNLQTLRQQFPASAADIGKACEVVSELGSDIQALSHRLHSSKLEYLGLQAAAAGFCRELSEHHQVEVDFRAEDISKEVPRDVSLCLFRVLQEALQNAAKHSGAKRFEVALRRESDEIRLIVRDQGIGFDVEDTVNSCGIGLTSMRERLKLVDGELSIESRPKAGTTVHARVPLAPKVRSTSG